MINVQKFWLSLSAVVVSDVNVSSNWRGYLAIWFSESSTADNDKSGLTKCRALSKVGDLLYYSWNSLDDLISNLNHLPVDVLFQSFVFGYLDPRSPPSSISSIFRFVLPLRVRNTGRDWKWSSSGYIWTRKKASEQLSSVLVLMNSCDSSQLNYCSIRVYSSWRLQCWD